MNAVLPFSKDYCTNKGNALALVTRIKEFYYSQGYTNFDVWLDPRPVYSPDGSRETIFYDIRSSLKFKVPK